MMVYAYNTIKSVSEGFYKEKGSKFIAKAFPAATVGEVQEILDALRKEYHDARHHCYAYQLEPDASLYRANDDGEPNHSAGDPILGQIRSLELTNTLVVVIRYFGGTKLGVSGLINAYKTAAAEALAKARVIRVEVRQAVEFHFSYPETNEVMKLIGKYEVKVSQQHFEINCSVKGKIPLHHLETMTSEVELLNKLGKKISLKID